MLLTSQVAAFSVGGEVSFACKRRCQNGGVCVEGNRCRCPKGFRGRFCHKRGKCIRLYTFMWQVRFFFHFSQMPRRVQKRRHLCRPRSLPLLPRLLGEKLQDCSVRSTLSGNKYFIQQRLANARTFVAERRKMQAETGSPEKLRSWSPRRRRLPKKERDQVHHGLQVQDGVLRQPVPAPVVVTEVPFCVLKGGGGGVVYSKKPKTLSS